MTIAAGFNCSDGVVLATDTLYSGSNQNDQGPKMWIVQAEDPVVIVAATGIVGAMLRAEESIRLKLTPGIDLPEVLDIIDTELATINVKFPPVQGVMSVQALVAIRVHDRTYLYQNVAWATALSPVKKPSVCIGQETLGDYFAKALFNKGMSIEWASVVAAHLVWNCKEYADGYCGGETHLGQLPRQGTPEIITDQHKISLLEDHLAGLDRAYKAVLPAGSPMESDSPATLRARAKVIIKAIQDAEMATYDDPGETEP